jgi:tRNA U34 5-methylaminomethyl-2-thiouridine-forming methyltransferase MnmC
LGRGWDVVYFDAFAPEKQPAMWSPEAIARVFEAMAPGGILTTYCAKGAIRRLLESVGFVVERIPGPPGGKREVLRARKPKA